MRRSIGFIGAGNMAGAILGGILGSNFNGELLAYDIDSAKIDRFGGKVKACASLTELLQKSDYLFFAVKPQVLDSVLAQINESGALKPETVCVTLVVGVSTGYYQKVLGISALSVIRIMPNTPMLLGFGATAICRSGSASEEQMRFVSDLLCGCSIVGEITEEQMNAVTGVNGSSPAYLFLFAKAVCEYAEENGIAAETAMRLFAQTMIGSAHMLTDSGLSADELIRMVCSPGGTTLESMAVFEKEGFTDIIKKAMAACTRRAGELGK